MSFNTKIDTIPTSQLSIDDTNIYSPKYNWKDGSLPESVKEAGELLKADQVVAMPTETVYGLAGNAFSSAAVEKIFKAKGRPNDNPLIIHISDLGMLKQILPEDTALPKIYEQVIKKHWPGPLTILLPKGKNVPDCVTAGHPTVAVRFPEHPIARAMIHEAGVPLAAPSANTSGKPSPTLADHVLQDLKGLIPLIIDSGSCDVGIESTVLDGLRQPACILRPGGVTLEQLRQVELLENCQVYKKGKFVESEGENLEECPTTPGMKYKHYSPSGQITLIQPGSSLSTEENFEITITNLLNDLSSPTSSSSSTDTSIAVILTSALTSSIAAKLNSLSKPPMILSLYDPNNDQSVSQLLFKAFRDCDSAGIKHILMEGLEESGLNTGIMNRMIKASSIILKY